MSINPRRRQIRLKRFQRIQTFLKDPLCVSRFMELVRFRGHNDPRQCDGGGEGHAREEDKRHGPDTSDGADLVFRAGELASHPRVVAFEDFADESCGVDLEGEPADPGPEEDYADGADVGREVEEG